MVVILTLGLNGAVLKMRSDMNLSFLLNLSLYLYVTEPNGVDAVLACKLFS